MRIGIVLVDNGSAVRKTGTPWSVEATRHDRRRLRVSPFLALFLSLSAGVRPASAAVPGAQASYIGGTRADIPNNSRGSLQAIDEQYFAFYGKGANVRVPYDKINLIEYGQKVGRRYMMAAFVSPVFILSKHRQHFLTVVYEDDNGREQALIFRVDKDDIRSMLVSLEARTGRKVQYQDDEARKAGKG